MIGEKIKALRTSKGLSLRAFGEIVGLSPTYLSELENSIKSASESTLDKIISAMDLPVDYFNSGSKAIEIVGKENAVKSIMEKVIENMTSMGTYRQEFDPIISVYADILYQYELFTQAYEDLGYPTENDFGRKPVILTNLEALRKDLVTYSDRLMLNPKAIQSAVITPDEPKSKLTQALRLING